MVSDAHGRNSIVYTQDELFKSSLNVYDSWEGTTQCYSPLTDLAISRGMLILYCEWVELSKSVYWMIRKIYGSLWGSRERNAYGITSEGRWICASLEIAGTSFRLRHDVKIRLVYNVKIPLMLTVQETWNDKASKDEKNWKCTYP